jgi:hypothetical protein
MCARRSTDSESHEIDVINADGSGNLSLPDYRGYIEMGTAPHGGRGTALLP